ncbi:hypothetical protein [Fischerella sp. PCC 9605]|uniref:hypothetical protein n=1 Tax=Fischerella sp. PCC 9605 TaxID=1173024 RepID=UPI000479C683|nr:hypothetical protein [Fischerella sp. PCC 9605]
MNAPGAEDAETRELKEEMSQLAGTVIGAAIVVHRVLNILAIAISTDVVLFTTTKPVITVSLDVRYGQFIP